jgi:hypothetical protein
MVLELELGLGLELRGMRMQLEMRNVYREGNDMISGFEAVIYFALLFEGRRWCLVL